MKYKSILTPFKRSGHKKPLIFGEFSKEEFKYLAYSQWYLNEKIDGTNIRIEFDGDTVKIDGRSDNAEIPEGLYSLLQTMFSIDNLKITFPKITKELNKKVILYGEGIGEKINGNRHDLVGYDFVLFDVLIDNFWLSQNSIEVIASMLNLKFSPIICQAHLYEAFNIVSKGLRSNFGGWSEGVIAKPIIQLNDKHGDRIITKIKYDDFKNYATEIINSSD